MFCDLAGSTSISARLDAEEWRDLVGAYLDAASAAVTEMGGHVAKKLGDGLMALFGYPVAQENDAERAVRAALAIHWPGCYSEKDHHREATDNWRRYLARDCQSEWAIRASRSWKFCEMRVHLGAA
jgi:class 3 adenylate cyclase